MKHKKNSGINKKAERLNYLGSVAKRTSLLQIIPAILFTSVVIMITRLKVYNNPLKEFWWNQQSEQLADFFSYYKMYLILSCAAFALCVMLYLCIAKRIQLKQSYYYIPMLIFSLGVIVSFAFSDYKDFSLFGWPDRFEGTMVLLAYMVMLFYIINLINSERDVKLIVYSVFISCALLGLLGLSQGIGHDFFASETGRRLIIPSEYWQYLDQLIFKFKNQEIYQTVYNINYVSFYLSLVLPIVGIFFLTSGAEMIKTKAAYALLFGLLVYNLFGASSSGGIFGIAVAAVIALIVFNKKLLKWKSEIVILIVITFLMTIINFNTFLPELSNTINSTLGEDTSQQIHEKSDKKDYISSDNIRKPKIEYIETTKDSVTISLNGEVLEFHITRDEIDNTIKGLKLFDANGSPVLMTALNPEESDHQYSISDQRFSFCTIDFAEDNENEYLIINTPGMQWAFLLKENQILYRTSYGSLVDLHKINSFGFQGREGFGSGRGYIWSRSFPLLKDTIIWGHGADTFAAYFPHDDFAGKYTGPSFTRNINTVIRKPHNFYIGTAINTGVISLIALLVLFLMYIFQSLIIYRKNTLESFLSRAGAGIFLGICSFLTAALVYDGNVCVMPLFYGLLGTGISINSMLHVSGILKGEDTSK